MLRVTQSARLTKQRPAQLAFPPLTLKSFPVSSSTSAYGVVYSTSQPAAAAPPSAYDRHWPNPFFTAYNALAIAWRFRSDSRLIPPASWYPKISICRQVVLNSISLSLLFIVSLFIANCVPAFFPGFPIQYTKETRSFPSNKPANNVARLRNGL